MVESSMANTGNSMEMESPSMFSVDQVWEQEGRRYSHVEDMQEEEVDRVFAGRHRVGVTLKDVEKNGGSLTELRSFWRLPRVVFRLM